MANPVVRPCVSCGNPVETRRLTSTPTCSTKCYMRLRRQAEKGASTLSFKIGNVVVTLTDLAPGTDREALQRDIIASLPSD
jgi:predicted nucleic acid-binding Zn ribbon protein